MRGMAAVCACTRSLAEGCVPAGRGAPDRRPDALCPERRRHLSQRLGFCASLRAATASRLSKALPRSRELWVKKGCKLEGRCNSDESKRDSMIVVAGTLQRAGSRACLLVY